ncbi:MAG: hypothetical protein K2N23_04025, partial [Clostridia bacterium]|nr:hypothetical protein [Clostridia bacterium]
MRLTYFNSCRKGVIDSRLRLGNTYVASCIIRIKLGSKRYVSRNVVDADSCRCNSPVYVIIVFIDLYFAEYLVISVGNFSGFRSKLLILSTDNGYSSACDIGVFFTASAAVTTRKRSCTSLLYTNPSPPDLEEWGVSGGGRKK